MGILGACMVPHPPLIVPEVGKGGEKQIQKTVDAYHQAAQRTGQLQPETIILFSPHQTMYADYFHISPGSHAEGDFGQFNAAQVKVAADYDTAFVKELSRRAAQKGLPAGTQGARGSQLDHGTMVPLYFINQYWQDYQLVRIGLSGLPLGVHYALGQCIQETVHALGRRTVLVASGDLSHRLKADGPYGYQKEGPAYDSRIMDIMGRAAFGELLQVPEDFCAKAGECGHRSFTILAGALDGAVIHPHRLSYEGPFGVGYGVCIYEIEQERSFDL